MNLVLLSPAAFWTTAEYTILTVNEFSSISRKPVGPQILIPKLMP